MQEQDIIITPDAADTLTRLLADRQFDRLFVLTDHTTQVLCAPLVQAVPAMAEAVYITIGSSDTHKTLDTMAHVWQQMGEAGGSRHSYMLCLGGGMVTDLGGFAASTFKRGIAYTNIPTTLLGMVDAAVGGKTGINFNGLKNEIGVFNKAEAVVVDTNFLRTLDNANIRSGYAEMLKHGLISDRKMLNDLLAFDLDTPNFDTLLPMVGESIAVKERIVTEDPYERGLRKALNLGHTVGHAFESLLLHRGTPVLHGYAVAWGCVCELYLSLMKCAFPQEVLRQLIHYVKTYYGTFPLSCKDYPHLIDLMRHDKKNAGGVINFTLLSDVGQLQLNQTATEEEITEMLDFFRENL